MNYNKNILNSFFIFVEEAACFMERPIMNCYGELYLTSLSLRQNRIKRNIYLSEKIDYPILFYIVIIILFRLQ